MRTKTLCSVGPVSDYRPCQSRVVGVLGGMGPTATVDFYDKLVRATQARTDQDHLKVVIWADPTVPSRQAAIAGVGESPIHSLRQGVRNLVAVGADLLVCPCNTAHAFLPEIAAEEGIELISIVDTAVASIVAARGQRVGLLATDGALSARLFQPALRSAAMTPVLPSEQSQQQLMQAIYQIKSETATKAAVVDNVTAALGEFAEQDVDTVLVGCTELSTIVDQLPKAAWNLVDASQTLVERTVLEARRTEGTVRERCAL
jgi:aspartate racemase